jgi:ubiquinone/menaquinone biosynthesis C-methylase UbiE
VTAFDLSQVSVAVTQNRAALNHVGERVALAVAAGEALPYADESFDVLFGKAILHHLDVNFGWHELYRVLKPGGKAVFVEPMGMNPLLKFARSWIPYPSKNPRGADRPLNYREIDEWGKQFREFRYQEIQLLSMLERGLGFKRRLPKLRRLDAYLLHHLPFLRRYCRYVVMFMVK